MTRPRGAEPSRRPAAARVAPDCLAPACACASVARPPPPRSCACSCGPRSPCRPLSYLEPSCYR
eukprot:1052335-Prymnesium_polylepis.1